MGGHASRRGAVASVHRRVAHCHWAQTWIVVTLRTTLQHRLSPATREAKRQGFDRTPPPLCLEGRQHTDCMILKSMRLSGEGAACTIGAFKGPQAVFSHLYQRATAVMLLTHTMHHSLHAQARPQKKGATRPLGFQVSGHSRFKGQTRMMTRSMIKACRRLINAIDRLDSHALTPNIYHLVRHRCVYCSQRCSERLDRQPFTWHCVCAHIGFAFTRVTTPKAP